MQEDEDAEDHSLPTPDCSSGDWVKERIRKRDKYKRERRRKRRRERQPERESEREVGESKRCLWRHLIETNVSDKKGERIVCGIADVESSLH